MAHDYESSKRTAFKIISILAFITIAEVLFALWGKGHLIEGFEIPIFSIPIPFTSIVLPFNIIALVMILMSIIKAYLIIYEFMHMKYEIPGLVKSVLLPMFLLVWAIIAFLYEGTAWKGNRTTIQERNQLKVDDLSGQSGMIYEMKETDLTF